MKRLLLSVSLSLLSAGSCFPAPIAAVDSGWYDSTGQHESSLDNYLTGVISGEELRSYFVFNLTGFAPGSITGANLTLSNRDAMFQNLLLAGTAGAPFTLNVYDVESPASDVTGGLNGLAVFNDLGAGTLLGSLAIGNDAPGDVVLTFNAAGLALLNANAGNTLVIALSLANAGAADQYIFANEGNAGEFGDSLRQLNLEIANTTPADPGAQAPEPTTSTLMLGAVATLAWWSRSRRNARARREETGAPAPE